MTDHFSIAVGIFGLYSLAVKKENLTEGSRDAARRVLEHCKGMLLGLERMVEKAQVVNLESGMERGVKKFKEGEIGRFNESEE